MEVVSLLISVYTRPTWLWIDFLMPMMRCRESRHSFPLDLEKGEKLRAALCFEIPHCFHKVAALS